MGALPLGSSRLQRMLQAAVQSVEWTHCIFWQFCPQQGLLVWADGYYNGTIKTRKTVQAMEVTAEDAMTQRSQQLRELYETLMAGENNQPPPMKRAFAALSPEDLTESEWFYLMCVSFSFPPGSGLPGKAYGMKRHVWLTGADEVDTKTFSRAILAKSAKILTVVCIPLLGGIVELGTTDKVREDLGFICHIKSFFTDQQDGHQYLCHPPPSNPALSDHSTSSNPSSCLPPNITYTEPLVNHVDPEEDLDINVDDDADDQEEDEEAEDTDRLDEGVALEAVGGGGGSAADPSELMQLDMSEDIRLGSPDDVSNHLDPDFHMLAATQTGNAIHGPSDDFFVAESGRPCPCSPNHLDTISLQPHSIELPITAEDEGGKYSQTVSTILQAQAQPASASARLSYSSTQSSFAKWTNRDATLDSHAQGVEEGASQLVLKYILSSVPFLHTKLREETSSPKSRPRDPADVRLRRTTTSAQDELSANHVVAERRRREKLNERFIMLRSLVPFVTKMDKVSILGDTIEYVKQLRKKIQDLESENRQERRTRPSRKTRISEGRGGSRAGKISAVVEAEDATAEEEEEAEAVVEVSIIESDALLEMRCENREGLLLDILQVLRELLIETKAVQSTVKGGTFETEIRAKVKDNFRGKKASITEVKRAINQIIPSPR